MSVSSVTQHTIEASAPSVKVAIVAHNSAVIVSCGDLESLKAVFFKEFDFARHKVWLNVAMAKCADFLGIHPIEEAFLATIAPSPDAAVRCQGDSVVFSHGHIDNLVFLKPLDVLGLREVDRVLIPMAKHTPVALPEGMQLPVLTDESRVAQTDAKFLHVHVIVRSDPLRVSFGHLQGCRDCTSFSTESGHP